MVDKLVILSMHFLVSLSKSNRFILPLFTHFDETKVVE